MQTIKQSVGQEHLIVTIMNVSDTVFFVVFSVSVEIECTEMHRLDHF